jgi:ABC-2 type transport system permease protein
MRLLGKMSWLELKLFLREPLTVLFALALPLLILFVMGGVFGNEAEAGFYRDIGAMDYYVPAYVALVTASLGLISLPVHIAGNREHGVLKRYHASSIPAWVVVGASIATMFVIATLSAVLLVVVAKLVHDVVMPDSYLGVIAAFALCGLAFGALGVLLGAILPNARSAQALGVLLWFVMMMLGGAGPPPEVLSGGMDVVGKLTPLRHGIRVLQDSWLSLDAGLSWLIVAIILVLTTAIAIRYFDWE